MDNVNEIFSGLGLLQKEIHISQAASSQRRMGLENYREGEEKDEQIWVEEQRRVQPKSKHCGPNFKYLELKAKK